MTSQQSPSRFKRAATLALYWNEGGLVCENYLTKSRAAVNSKTVAILDYFREWRTSDECETRFPDLVSSTLLRLIEQSLKLSFLVREGTSQAETDATVSKAWSAWLPKAGLLHFGTRNMPYVWTLEEQRAVFESTSRESPEPLLYKTYPGALATKLPEPRRVSANFHDVLFKRRTHRQFSAEALAVSDLSTLLYNTWGVTGFIDDPLFGRLPLKTSPSGGARHPEEVYVYALRVDGLAPGTYHYAAERHSLQRLSEEASPARAVDYCGGQQWVANASALFIMTAVFGRTMWKYPFSRAYRVVMAEAGHLCQTFCLVACALGLAPFSTMALNDSGIEAGLGVNGFDETVLYVAGVGSPVPASLQETSGRG